MFRRRRKRRLFRVETWARNVILSIVTSLISLMSAIFLARSLFRRRRNRDD